MEGIIGILLTIFFILSVYEFHKSFKEVKAQLGRIEEKLESKKVSK